MQPLDFRFPVPALPASQIQRGEFVNFHALVSIRRGKIFYMVLVPARTPFDCRTTYFFYFYIPYFSFKKEMI